MIKYFKSEDFPKEGELQEMDSGIPMFSKKNFRPLQPYHCPVCAKSLAYGDKDPMVKKGFCMTCTSWWEEKNEVLSEVSFSEKADRYFEWAKIQVKKNLKE